MLRENKRMREDLGSENIRGAKIKGIKVNDFGYEKLIIKVLFNDFID